MLSASPWARSGGGASLENASLQNAPLQNAALLPVDVRSQTPARCELPGGMRGTTIAMQPPVRCSGSGRSHSASGWGVALTQPQDGGSQALIGGAAGR